MFDAAGGFLPNRNAGGGHLVEQRAVERVLFIRIGIGDEADGDAGLFPLDELGGEAGILEEPRADVDPDLLRLDAG